MKTASYIRMSSLGEKEVKMNGAKTDEDDNLTMDSGPLGNVRYARSHRVSLKYSQNVSTVC